MKKERNLLFNLLGLFLKSKTLAGNVLLTTALVLVLKYFGIELTSEEVKITEGVFLLLIGAAPAYNIFMRFFTKKPLNEKRHMFD